MRFTFAISLLLAGCSSRTVPIGSCHGLDERTCADAGCRPRECSCGGRIPVFNGCYDPDEALPACSAALCTSPCSTQNESGCINRPDCHAVFQPYDACGCAGAGCCTGFSHCADGKANCTGPAACDIKSPACEGPYVVSYTSSCYEGCVLATQCP